MLSYKLKHLCSRVIASLSAVGLFSITDTGKAAAAEYNFGASAKVEQAKTFTANYEKDTTIVCSTSGVDIAVSSYVSGLNANGVLACSYILKKGFVYYDSTGTCLAAGVSSAPETKYFNSGASCDMGTYSGNLYSAIKGTGISNFPQHVQTLLSEVTSAESGQYVVTVTGDSSGYAKLDAGALGYAPVKVTFDCTANSGKYASDATGYAYTYSGGSITLPDSDNCVAPSGYTFSGWMG